MDERRIGGRLSGRPLGRIAIAIGIGAYVAMVAAFGDPVQAIGYSIIGASVGLGVGYLAGKEGR